MDHDHQNAGSETTMAPPNGSPPSHNNHRMSISSMLTDSNTESQQAPPPTPNFTNRLQSLLNSNDLPPEPRCILDKRPVIGNLINGSQDYIDHENDPEKNNGNANILDTAKISVPYKPTLQDYQNLSADQLYANFKQRTKAIVDLDSISMTDVNKLKFLENEFQILTYPNGVYVNNKFIDQLKNYLLLKDNKMLDKLIKREKAIAQDSNNYDQVKNQQLKFIIDAIRANKLRSYQLEMQEIGEEVNLPADVLAMNGFSTNDPAALSNDINGDINTENGLAPDLSNSTAKTAGSKRQKNGSAQQNASSLPGETPQKGGKRKRKAAIAANDNIESKAYNDSFNDIDDSFDQHSVESAPVTKRKKGTRKKAANANAAGILDPNDPNSKNADDPDSTAAPTKRKRKTKLKIALENGEQPAGPPAKKQRGKAANKEGTGKGKGSRKNAAAAAAADKDAADAGEDGADSAEPKLPKVKLTLKPRITLKEQRAIDKQYDNTYISIWKDLARKDGPKAYRMFQQSNQAKQINFRKTSLLAARESKRWEIKTNKSQKDLVTKARRSMREMMNFWKKNEREERDLRKKAEKEAADVAKKEEEERESRRQARKLNFLITQTELYSHFIGNKIKTDEFEGSMGDKSITAGMANSKHTTTADNVDLSHANKDFNSLDFGDDNEENLTKAAAANAQTALLEAQAKAQAFNQDLPKDANADDDSEMNFQNPTSLGEINIEQPKLLNCTLKEYQMKGLNWLANLYDQGINGILADEMGLGKTVQSISVLSYLAETHNIWGPFLVVTPASTLHNWQQEITRFVPDFKVLPYWGTAKDRKVLRKFWDRKNIIYKKDSPIHVVVTSYQLVVADAQYFGKMKWQYMILDEAQAIKSSSSSRWKSLLSLQCRNRLLLTGTPIQNSMQELWALLHFIMPSLFDSHDEFSEWFSKDIEAHAQSNTELNEQQLRRLHMILKPFMLRRIKKNVQSELGDKIELDIYCDLTNRQKKQYRMLRSQINLMDLIENSKKIGADDNQESLMNVVMQFRKVCNHPDLFERADTKSSFNFSRYAATGSLLREANESLLEYNYSSKNLIEYKLPRLIVEDLLSPTETFDSLIDRDNLIHSKFNIWSPENIKESSKNEGAFNWLKFVDYSIDEIVDVKNKNLLQRSIDLRSYTGKTKNELLDRYHNVYDGETTPMNKLFMINTSDVTHNEEHLKELASVQRNVYYDMYLNVSQPGAFEIASAPPIDISCSLQRFNFLKNDSLYDPKIRSAMNDLNLNTQYDLYTKGVDLEDYPKAEMMCQPINSMTGFSSIRLPSMERFVIESAKLAKLDEMLVELKKGGHKCLLYFQMTRMMDLMEEFLTYRQYKYIRLDGSSKLSDRRDLVHDWQTKPELFIFLLSTRAGGLGINLTAADTVIFYDSDWNPTIDSQAMDRAHRLGQTRQVTVYRLLVRGTIEERMRDRAKQKEHVQQVVMEGKSSIKSASASGSGKDNKDVAMWLLNDDENENEEDSNGDDKVQEMDNKLQELYHEGEGKFESGTVTPLNM